MRAIWKPSCVRLGGEQVLHLSTQFAVELLVRSQSQNPIVRGLVGGPGRRNRRRRVGCRLAEAGCCSMMRQPPNLRTRSSVSSVEPKSATRISSAMSRTDSRQPTIVSAALWQGISTVTS